MRKKCSKGKSCGETCIYNRLICEIELGVPLSKSLGTARDGVSAPVYLSTPKLESKPIGPKNSTWEREKRVTELALQIRARRRDGLGFKELWNEVKGHIDLLEGDAKRRAVIRANSALGKRLNINVTHSLSTVKEAIKAGDNFLKDYSFINPIVSLSNRYGVLKSSMEGRLKDPKLSSESRSKLERRLLSVKMKLMAQEEKLVSIMSEIRDKLLNTSLTDKQVNDLVGRVWKIGHSDDKIEKHLVEFVRMFNGRGLTDFGDSPAGKGLKRVTESTERAKAYTSSGRILTNSFKPTVFHEIAHLIEGQRPWMSGYAVIWRNNQGVSGEEARSMYGLRTLGAKEFQVNSKGRNVPVFPLNNLLSTNSFRDNEVAVAGNFLSPYMGRVYKPESGTKQRSTEVWSTAFEKFSDPQSMATLYKAHPDLFSAVVGMAVSP